MSLAEYELLMKAVRLKQVDLDYRCHMVAFLVKSASAEKSSGKGKTQPVYKTFKKFYDYDKAIEEALKDNHRPSDRLMKIKAYRERNKED